MTSIGWWTNHPFKKHSVNEIDEFVGWGKLQAIAEAGNSLRNKALPCVLFHTGTRVSEGIQLRKGHFDLSDPNWVQALNIPIVKQKVSKPFRTFSFPRTEPTWHFVEEYLVSLGENAPLFPFDRTQSYNIVKALGKSAGLEVWNHWFRSQRASQMGAEYEMTENDLMEWFKVKDRNWARRYCKRGTGDYGRSSPRRYQSTGTSSFIDYQLSQTSDYAQSPKSDNHRSAHRILFKAKRCVSAWVRVHLPESA